LNGLEGLFGSTRYLIYKSTKMTKIGIPNQLWKAASLYFYIYFGFVCEYRTK